MQQATKKPLYWGEEYLKISVLEFCRMFGREWNSKWQPTQIFLPGKYHGQRNLAGYRLWGPKESDMTGQLSMPHASVHRRGRRQSVQC